MRRFMLALALCATPAFVAEGQYVVSCPGVTGGPTYFPGVPCDGLFAWASVVNGGTFTFFGDNGLGYLLSPTDFTFVSALFQSKVGVHNQIRVYGYTRDDIARAGEGFPFGVPGRFTYSAGFFAEPGFTTPVEFNWADVGALGFDSWGGRDPSDVTAAFLFDVSRVTVLTTTPEPASLTLLGTGLLALLGLRRLRSQERLFRQSRQRRLNSQADPACPRRSSTAW